MIIILYIVLYIYYITVLCKSLWHISPLHHKKGFKTVIFIFFCSVQVGFISLQLQTFLSNTAVLLNLVSVFLCFFMHHRLTRWWWDQMVCGSYRLLCIHKSYWIITINGKINVWKCKLIYTLLTQQKITCLKPFLVCENMNMPKIFVQYINKNTRHFQ